VSNIITPIQELPNSYRAHDGYVTATSDDTVRPHAEPV
jgi:hypothetical protein